MRRRALALVALLACSSAPPAPAPAPPPPPPPPPPPATAPAPAKPTALLITAPPSPLAPWLQSPLPARPPPFTPLIRPSAVSWGKRSLIAFDPNAAAPGWFGVHLDHGAVGPLGDGDTVWVGIGARNDQVFIATADDRLLAATDLRTAARAGGAVPVGTFEGASAFAAAPGIVAVAHGDKVSVSTDGKRFRSAVVARDRVITQLAARHDGVLVALTRPRNYQADMVGGDTPITFVSRGGRRWEKSRWQPNNIEQDGAWITDTHPCNPAVLGAGSTRWVQVGEHASTSGLKAMTDLLAHDRTGNSSDPAKYRTALLPRPPRFDPAKEARYRPGDCGSGHGVGRGYRGRPNTGTDVLRALRGHAGAPPPVTATGLALLADGACPVSPILGAPLACRLTRAPHPLAWNRGDRRARVLDLPPDCLPRLTTAAGGLALLHCAAEQVWTSLHALGPTGQWIAEGTIRSSSSTFTTVAQAADGTLLLVDACEAPDLCHAWVRRPLALGNRSAWRELTGGAVYRVLPGGAALVLEATPTSDPAVSVTLELDRPGQPRQRLLAGVTLDAPLKSLEIVNGTVVVDVEGRGRQVIASDGSLLPAP